MRNNCRPRLKFESYVERCVQNRKDMHIQYTLKKLKIKKLKEYTNHVYIHQVSRQ